MTRRMLSHVGRVLVFFGTGLLLGALALLSAD